MSICEADHENKKKVTNATVCRDLPELSLPATETAPHAAAGPPTALLQCMQTEDTQPPGDHLYGPETPVSFPT